MSNAAATAPSTRTGGPRDHGSLAEHIAGWALVIVVAMLLTTLHLA
jgi:hypothetical protein